MKLYSCVCSPLLSPSTPFLKYVGDAEAPGGGHVGVVHHGLLPPRRQGPLPARAQELHAQQLLGHAQQHRTERHRQAGGSRQTETERRPFCQGAAWGEGFRQEEGGPMDRCNVSKSKVSVADWGLQKEYYGRETVQRWTEYRPP